ncbi:hypothetical protein WR25_25728 [Diploscapter pachys]|uniref:Phlebovirus glycoprotein G2 fusion domain-containing protein n=1 Tax=Diploscapter pachys TaxID=2018661 RepID=A0A2A2KW75_9BILA|nr:hypothetical protein WR25_25728 [Diploscapter pachys]
MNTLQILNVTVIFLQIILISRGDEVIVTTSGQSYNCKDAKQFPRDCQISIKKTLVLSSENSQTNLKILDRKNQTGRMTFKLLNFTQSCDEVDDFYTRDVNATFKSAKRCYRMGNCTDNTCETLQLDGYITDLEDANNFGGASYCDAILGSGCLSSYSCIFTRTYVLPLTSEIYRVSHCRKWENFATIEIAFHDAHSSESSIIVLKQGEVLPISKLNVQLTWLSHHAPNHEFSREKFIRNLKSEETFLWPKDEQPIIACNSTKQSMYTRECIYRDTCKCSLTYDATTCRCSKFSIKNDIENDTSKKFPITKSDLTLNIQNNTIVAGILSDFYIEIGLEYSAENIGKLV